MTEQDLSDIWRFELRKGNSSDPRDGACLLDAVSYIEYGELGDHPPCVCPVLAAFGRGVNDAMSHEGRQRLKIFIPRLVGTVDPEAVQPRAEYLAWQAVRVFAPIALDAAGLTIMASELRRFRGSLKEAAEAASAAANAAADANAVTAALTAGTAATAVKWAAAAAPINVAWAAEHAASRIAESAPGTAAIIAAMEGALAIGKQAEPIEPTRIASAQRTFAEAANL